MDSEINLFRKIRRQILASENLVSEICLPAMMPERKPAPLKHQGLHIHDSLELRLIFLPGDNGEGLFSELQEICLTPMGVPHFSLSEGDLKRHITVRLGAAEIYYMRGLNFIETYDASRIGLSPGIVLPELLRALDEIGYGRIHDPDQIRVLLAMIFSLLISFREGGESPASGNIADRIAAFMRANYFKSNLSIREIAEKNGVSPNYIQMIFRKRWGCSPLQYLNEVRLKNAQTLLQKHTYQVKEVAAMCGWTYAHYFGKKYLKYFGHLPSDE